MPNVRIPHQPPLRFLDDTCARIGDWLVVAARVPADGPGAAVGLVRPGYLIEIAAQATAAWDGAEAGESGGPAEAGGVLVAVKDWRWLGEAPADTALAVRVRRSGVLGQLAQFDCEIACAGRPVAAGVLTVARPA